MKRKIETSEETLASIPDYAPEKRKCFGSHPDSIQAECLFCPDEGDCDTATRPHTSDSEYDEHCECDPGGKKYRFKCPHCGGDTVSEELKAYSRVCCNLSGEFDPLDPSSYTIDFAEPLDDPQDGASYWCAKCGKNILKGATRSDLRKWLRVNNMSVQQSAVDLP